MDIEDLEEEYRELSEEIEDLKREVARLETEVEELELLVDVQDEDISLPWSQALELLNLNKDYIDPLELFEWIDKRAVVY